MSFNVNIENGLISNASQYESPNCDDRPTNARIRLIVIHGISLPPAEFSGGYIEKFFTNTLDIQQHAYFNEIKDLKVSSHLLIERDGQVKQFVPLHKRAWHAGISKFENQECCNDFSIGIELEGTDDLPYTDKQYSILQQLCDSLMQTYPDIKKTNIVGHCDISPGRKTDPGPSFDWQRFKAPWA